MDKLVHTRKIPKEIRDSKIYRYFSDVRMQEIDRGTEYVQNKYPGVHDFLHDYPDDWTEAEIERFQECGNEIKIDNYLGEDAYIIEFYITNFETYGK